METSVVFFSFFNLVRSGCDMVRCFDTRVVLLSIYQYTLLLSNQSAVWSVFFSLPIIWRNRIFTENGWIFNAIIVLWNLHHVLASLFIYFFRKSYLSSLKIMRMRLRTFFLHLREWERESNGDIHKSFDIEYFYIFVLHWSFTIIVVEQVFITIWNSKSRYNGMFFF